MVTKTAVWYCVILYEDVLAEDNQKKLIHGYYPSMSSWALT